MAPAQMDWIVCGRAIGTISAWDQTDRFVMRLFGFQAAPGYKGPVGECISLDFDRGTIKTHDEEGNVISSDLINAIKDCPRATPE